MISNVKKGTTCRSLSWSQFKRIIIKFKLFDKDTRFVILVTLSLCFGAILELLKVIKMFIKRAYVFIWNKDNDLFF